MSGHPSKASDSRALADQLHTTVLWTAVLISFASLGSGCATYNEKLEKVRTEADRGAYPKAIGQLNGILDVDSVKEIPDSLEGDRSLAALERSVLLQTQSEYALSARDLSSAEEELELLEFDTDASGTLGKYLYSDSSDNYTPSPTERIAMSSLNMANYLALGDLDGAAVEARRYTNTRDYLASLESLDFSNLGTFGAYLAGFTFEHLGEGDRALRYYEEALEGGALESLVGPIARLANLYPYRGPRINASLSAHDGASVEATDRSAEILIIVSVGRVPRKVPKRIPIGAAVGIAGTWVTGNTDIIERSLFKVVVYPELTDSTDRSTQTGVSIDGRPSKVELVSHLGSDIQREYEEIKPQIIGAAISRMIARAVAAEGARMAGRQAGSAGGIVGLLAAFATEGSLVALDKPDTRSWSFLPNRVSIARMQVRAGTHEIEIQIGGLGESHSVTLDIPEAGFGVVLVAVPR